LRSNQLTAVGGASLVHDDNGNISTIGAAGYGYDSENRLVSAPGGVTLGYDPLGRLYQVSDGTTTRLFLYDGDHLFGEYAANGAPLMFYENGPDVDEPVMWFNYSTFEFGTLHGDERGSVVASVASGATTTLNRYDEYGNPQGGSITGRFGYTGQIWLQQAGLYHYRARAYNPALGRFMQTDPIGYEGGMNLYAYVGNNPVNLTDPAGTLPPIMTGTRIPNKQDWGPFCGSCSGFSTAGFAGTGQSGSIDVYKVSLVDSATKAPVGNPWIEVRGTGFLASLFVSSAPGDADRCRWTPLFCALSQDRDVGQRMFQSLAESCYWCATDRKNENGFWISKFGNDYVAHPTIYGRGMVIEGIMRLRPSTARIFFHVHPFTAAEGGVMGFSRDDNFLINNNPSISWVIYGFKGRNWLGPMEWRGR
jgi:RHS repeat-associated protein